MPVLKRIFNKPEKFLCWLKYNSKTKILTIHRWVMGTHQYKSVPKELAERLLTAENQAMPILEESVFNKFMSKKIGICNYKGERENRRCCNDTNYIEISNFVPDNEWVKPLINSPNSPP